MDKTMIKNALSIIINQFPDKDYIKDVQVKFNYNNSEKIEKLSSELVSISVLHNISRKTHNSIDGDYDIQKAREYYDKI